MLATNLTNATAAEEEAGEERFASSLLSAPLLPSSTPGSTEHKIPGRIFPINVSRFRAKNVRMSVLPALLQAPPLVD